MKIRGILVLLFVQLVVFGASGQGLDKARTIQQGVAAKLMNRIQRGDTSNHAQFYSAGFYEKNKAGLQKFYADVKADFDSLPAGSKRYVTLVFPKG